MNGDPAAERAKEERRHWHIGKEIPLAVIVVLCLQTFGVIWWAATTSSQLTSIKDARAQSQMQQEKTDRRQDDERLQSETRIMTQLHALDTKLDRIIIDRLKVR